MLFYLRRFAIGCTVTLLIALAAACSEGPIDDTAGATHFSPLETDQVSPQVVPSPNMVPEAEREQVQAIVDGFRQNADTFFERGDPEGRLPQIESVFIASGRYLDLMGIYQNVVEKQGISSMATPRLARAYLRLGQDHKARELLDRMIAERSDDPISWFLNGAYWLPKAENSAEASAKVIANWQKALSVDPEFDGFEQPGAPSLREQLAALRQRTPPEEIEKAIAKLDETPDSATATATATATEQEPAPAQEPTPEQKPAPAQEPAPEQEPAPDLETEPATTPEAKPEPIAVTVARGQMAMSQGRSKQAEQFFNQALAREPQNVEARLGLIQNAWSDEARRNDLARSVRKLAERDDLTPRQQYEVGLFAFSKMSDPTLAKKLWKQVKQRDPQLAEAVGLDGLIERASR